MAKIDINAAISSSFDIVSRILFKPISIRMWLALGFASAMASVGSGGGSNLYNRSHPAGRAPGTGDISQNMRQFVETHLWLLVLAVVAIIALAVLFTWLASVFKFVYTDQIVRNSDEIREPFARLKSFGKSFFLWTLAYGLAVLLALGIFAALPILIGYYSLGAATAGGVTCIAIGVLLGVLIIIASIIADVFARDFVVTAMYKRHIGVMEAWREVLPILRANAGQMALYLLMLIVVGLAFVIISVFAAIAALIVIAIPAGLIAGICIAVPNE